jgi:hypothetical protein
MSLALVMLPGAAGINDTSQRMCWGRHSGTEYFGTQMSLRYSLMRSMLRSICLDQMTKDVIR